MPQQPKDNQTALAVKEMTHSERFSAMVMKQFVGEVGELNYTEEQKALAQHMFLKIDAAMIEHNKRKPGVEVSWNNVNLTKLVPDVVYRVQLGIDALIPGHLYPIFYWNEASKKYNADLRIGYVGEIYFKQRASLRPVRDIRVELVYSNDEFLIYKKGVSNKIEGYDLKIKDPFDRGDLLGGFGYVEYEDDKSNILVVLSKAEIEKYRGKSKSDDFWGPWYDQMAYKTIVHRTTAKIVIDPTKINIAAMAHVEAQDNAGYVPEDDTPLLSTDPVQFPPMEQEQPTDDGPGQASEEPF